MRRIYKLLLPFFLSVFALVVVFFFFPKNNKNKTPILTVYTYESLAGEWGLLPKVLSQFEDAQGLRVEVATFPDTGSMLGQLILEKDTPKADVVLGLDNVDFMKAKSEKLLVPYVSKYASSIPDALLFDKVHSLTPFDYGYPAFVYDTETISFEEPISLEDISSQEYKDKIVFEQPGLSSLGTQFLLWSNVVLDEAQTQAFWTEMSENVLTVVPDWNTAYYSMFLQGEAPIVFSYTTSPAYHIDQEGSRRYKSVPIAEGYMRQIEGVGIVKDTKNLQGAKAFVDFMLSSDVQKQIPTTQWMYPVIDENVSYPEAFDEILQPKENEVLLLSEDDTAAMLVPALEQWNKIFNIL